MDETDLYPITDYWYELSDEQILEHLERAPAERLQMLDDMRRFALIGRRAMIAAEKREAEGAGPN